MLLNYLPNNPATRWKIARGVAVLATLLLAAVLVQPTYACGGLFCQNSPVDQNAERIIFTQNDDGTISAIIQIQYTGFAEDFSWILPLPSAIGADDIEVPETAMNAFVELEISTAPVFIPPEPPQCVLDQLSVMEFAADADAPQVGAAGAVEVFASGEVGPFGFDVIGSDDPDALIIWLRDNNYLVTEQMEPLISVYVDEQFAFLAMRLLPESGVQEIQPVKVTYQGDLPIIPLRLTAVAANPDMAVLTWFYGEAQAIPDNFAHMEIADNELTFFTFGGHNYRQLMGERADEFGGQAFITEYASPTSQLPVADPLLVELGAKYRYVTRLNTVISPEEMTLDPVFSFDGQLPDVSNIHDLSGMTGLYDCEREASGGINLPLIGGGQNNNNNNSGTTIDPGSGEVVIIDSRPGTASSLLAGIVIGGALVFLGAGVIGLTVLAIRQSRK